MVGRRRAPAATRRHRRGVDAAAASAMRSPCRPPASRLHQPTTSPRALPYPPARPLSRSPATLPGSRVGKTQNALRSLQGRCSSHAAASTGRIRPAAGRQRPTSRPHDPKPTSEPKPKPKTESIFEPHTPSRGGQQEKNTSYEQRSDAKGRTACRSGHAVAWPLALVAIRRHHHDYATTASPVAMHRGLTPPACRRPPVPPTAG